MEVVGGPVRQRREVVHLPMLPAKGVPYCHENTVGNVLHSVRERVLGRTVGGTWVRTVKPEAGAFQTPAMLLFRRKVMRHIPRHSLPISRDQFIAQYRGQKQRRYVSAAMSLDRQQIRRADSYPGVFLKPEKWFEAKPGRLISARSPRYNLSLGVYTQPLEHALYRAVDEVYGSPCIMKGYTPVRRAAVAAGHWASLQNPVAVGGDYSKYDQHMSAPALSYEHGFYLGAYDDPELARLLAWQLDGKCFANCVDGKVRYEVYGGRMSGDMNTALGNCLVTAALIWAYCWELGISVRAMIDGDDSVVFLEKRDLARYRNGVAAWMLAKGFILVSEEPVYELDHVEFCQARYTDLRPPTMVRTPLKAITQDHTWIVKPDQLQADVLAATGLGGLSLYGNCPVLGAYYHCLSRASTQGAATLAKLIDESSWLRATTSEGVYSEPDEDARYAFWKTWGMEPGEQRALEQFFKSCDLQSIVDRSRSQNTENAVSQVYFPSLNPHQY